MIKTFQMITSKPAHISLLKSRRMWIICANTVIFYNLYKKVGSVPLIAKNFCVITKLQLLCL